MKVGYNLSFVEIVGRHILGLFLAILGGFLGYYVSPFFLVIVAFAPVMMLTAILGWCPIYQLLKINHATA
jgi:hypothetical protein